MTSNNDPTSVEIVASTTDEAASGADRDLGKDPFQTPSDRHPKDAETHQTELLQLEPAIDWGDPAPLPAAQASGPEAIEQQTTAISPWAPGSEQPPAAQDPPDSAEARPEPEPRATRRSNSPDDARSSEACTRVGLVGGKESGKTYLFQAMVYRTSMGRRAGAMAPFIVNNSLMRANQATAEREDLSLIRFSEPYKRWERIRATPASQQRWYRLRLNYRTGLRGSSRSLDLESFDGSGDLLGSPMSESTLGIWKDAYSEANVMIFCLPLWVVFPAPGLDQTSLDYLELAHQAFFQIIMNFTEIRRRTGQTHPVSTILALTMADDPRGSLEVVRERWIFRAIDSRHRWLRQVSTSAGVSRYLSRARALSSWLLEAFGELAADNMVAGIPDRLDFGAGRPWILPVSAIDGEQLDRIEAAGADPAVQLDPPVPAHVELPLLVAMCESLNAMM